MLSFGFMFLIGGATQRLRIGGLCSTLFIAGTGYCMSWRKAFADLCDWQNAWIGVSTLLAIGMICLYRFLLTRSKNGSDSEHD